MDKRVLKGWLNKEDITDKDQQYLIDLWDVLYDWGAYDGYYSEKELAYRLRIKVSTLRHKIQTFKKKFPEAYGRIKEHREVQRHVNTRLTKSLRNPISYDPEKHDEFIVEKF